MEKAKQEQEAHREIETPHPGYLGAQDTYYVGNITGVGRLEQLQTDVDAWLLEYNEHRPHLREVLFR